MTIKMNELIMTIATALDIVESELIGASTNHGKRIAVLCVRMGRYLGMNNDEINTLTTCALLHDNALTEYILSERKNEHQELNIRLHCEYGQRNIETLPCKADTKGLILYHHEHADGSGPFNKSESEFPVSAGLIAIADMVDVSRHLQHFDANELSKLLEEIKSESGKRYTKTAANALIAVLDDELLNSLRDENIDKTTNDAFPVWDIDIEDTALMRLSELVARIIDYKSEFTRKHSVQIANRAWLMGSYYSLDSSLKAKIYLAAAFHDIGKLAIPTDILEKPGKLDENEFNVIKGHVYGTYKLLSGITGFEDICIWASSHHEKLDGSGYPFGRKADELDFISRLLACTDIYQAVSEPRPYHEGRSHAETMPILYNMADKGLLDERIVKDFDTVMAEYSHTSKHAAFSGTDN